MTKIEDNKAHAIQVAKSQKEWFPKDRAHLGAVLVKGKQTVQAYNIMDKTHPDSLVWDEGALIAKGVHAEQWSLIKGRRFIDGATMFVARVTKNNDLAIARPCPSCRILIEEAKVRKVHYSIGPGEWGEWNV